MKKSIYLIGFQTDAYDSGESVDFESIVLTLDKDNYDENDSYIYINEYFIEFDDNNNIIKISK